MTSRTLFLVASLAAASAFAQVPAPAPASAPAPLPSPPQGPVQGGGFFKPSPDISLTAPHTDAAQMQLIESRAQSQMRGPAAESALEPPPAAPFAALRWTEDQMDRSTMENERARAQGMTMQPGINGAFDGTTSERNR